ncbi:histidine ammonia-lyase [Actinomadura fulvescens]|uniref:Histidine ammonia-lyase n=1 Tax=Actinomadura fulvescens TaxID=46160 RepID=A0ABN3QIQ4_9ACTN
MPTALTTARRTVVVSGDPLTTRDVIAVANGNARVRLTAAATETMAKARASVEALRDSPIATYGLNTGVGALADQVISPDRLLALQRSLLRSHAAGAGPRVEREVVRAMMLLRTRTLATGVAGVRPAIAHALIGLLNADLVPIVQEYGSLGCSGDLAPLAAVALALTGEGRLVAADGTESDAASALRRAGLQPLVLDAGEGLALINGTDGMLGMLVLAIDRLARLLDVADITAAMSVEALQGTDRVFAAELQALRPHRGQAHSAARISALLHDSPILAAARGRGVQDAYSLRCAPQVHGAAGDTVDHARGVAARELASVIDNPAVLPDGRLESNGNFHGAPLAYVLDFLAIAAADVASMCERRTDRLLDPARSAGLPAFLAADSGVDSGLMIAHYTQASVVADLKRLAAPASVDSIPTSAMQEDHVSMGWAAGSKLLRALDGLTTVLAIELLTAARALDLRAPLRPSPATGAVVAALREHVPGPGPDRHLAPEIAATAHLIRDGALSAAAHQVTNPSP